MKFNLLSILFVLSIQVFAQNPPCLNGWTYRTPVYIDNTSNSSSLTDFQVELSLNTFQLIADGKASLTGDDIRFLDSDGTVLPFWIDEDTYNSAATSIWVKVPHIDASLVDTIYLFYGQSSASSIASGESTFELFDDFLGASVDASKWDNCNSPQVSVTGGEIMLSSTATSTDRSKLTSVDFFTTPVVVEQDVTSINNGLGYLGLENSSENGFAMVYDVNGQPTMRMMIVNQDVDCIDLEDQASILAKSANTVTGTWSFSWLTGDEQQFDWPGATATEIRNETRYSTPAQAKVIFGNADKSGDISLDWVRVRKYTDVQPTLSLGTEVSAVTSVDVSSNAPICQGSDLELYATAVTGSIYSWTGPDGFVSSDQNPVVTGLSSTGTGYYVVQASITGGCSSVEDSVYVEVDNLSSSGTISGSTQVCGDGNSGEVVVDGITGLVTRWEQSATGLAPWSTIAETNDTITYQDLTATNYYRAVVQNGVCTEDISDSIQIIVDDITVGGVILGEDEHCADVNNGTLTLTNYTGTISNWQYKVDGTTNWIDEVNITKYLDYSNLSTTRYYRAVVQNGVCASTTSDSVEVTIFPNPVSDFDIDGVCFGTSSSFVNNSTISSGIIDDYIWDFGDGSSSVIENPSRTYSTDGNFTVQLTTVSDEGCRHQTTETAVVNPLPSVDFFFNNSCLNDEVTFKQNVFITSGSINDVRWETGDNIGSSTLPQFDYVYGTTGDFEAKLVAVSSENCSDSVTQSVTVYTRAVLDFEVDDVFLGETSEFINNSSIVDGSLSYIWYFDDAQTSSLTNPTHDYGTAGSYDVQLIGTSSIGSCTDTVTITHVVNDQSNASYTVEDVCLYDSASFVNTSFVNSGTLTYSWDFGDGNMSNEESPKHIYENPGTYSVELVATSDLGSVASYDALVTIHPLPSATMVMDNVCNGTPTQFTNLSSISGGSMTYSWDFGDSNTSTEYQPSHLYDTAGTYSVQMIAASNYSCVDTTTNTVSVFALPETGFMNDTVCEGNSTTFTDTTSISSGSITEYEWNFGDGQNSIEQNPSYLYLNPGSYTATLKTTSDNGCVVSASQVVTVYASPVASFQVSDVCFQEPIQTLNTSSSTDGQLSYSWDFADGTVSILTSPEHDYVLPGQYVIKLVATTAFGCQDSVYQTVNVGSTPTVSAGEDVTVSQGYPTILNGTGGETYFWTPAESLDNQSIQNPEATPFETTTYVMTATDASGCSAADSVTVFVEEDFKLEASNVVTPDGNGENDTWYVTNISSFPDAKVVILDRWGKVVLNQTNYQNDWEGTSGTDILGDGEYYYVITSSESDKVYRGTITIMRNR